MNAPDNRYVHVQTTTVTHSTDIWHTAEAQVFAYTT